MSETKTTREVLLAAAEEIERSGLHKGEYWPNPSRWTEGPCCTVGAVRRACGTRFDTTSVEDAVSVLERRLRCEVARWNDAPERTASDVIRALRAAAEGQA